MTREDGAQCTGTHARGDNSVNTTSNNRGEGVEILGYEGTSVHNRGSMHDGCCSQNTGQTSTVITGTPANISGVSAKY